jgi:hypothetical protein
MNERFRELAQLAVEDAAKYCQRSFDLTREENETFAMSFAELIIQECGVALSPMLRDMISRGQGYDLIKKHFGVES